MPPLGVLLARYKTATGATDAEIARMTGLHKNTIYNIRNGRTTVRSTTSRLFWLLIPDFADHISLGAEHGEPE